MLEKNKYSMRNITNDKVTEYIDERFIPLDQKLWRIRLDAENKYIPIIQRDVESLLVSLLNLNQPQNILEIGTAIGYSGSVMAKTLKEASIFTIERNKDMIALAKVNLENLDLTSRVNILEGDARQILEELIVKVENGQLPPFDFVFVDAAKSHYLEFWQLLEKLTKKGSVVVCDNILMRGMTVDDAYDIHDKHRTNIRKMREFLDYLLAQKNTQTSILPVGDGVTISYFK